MPFSLCFWCFPAAAFGGAALSILIVFLFSMKSSVRRPSSDSSPPPPGSRGLPLIGETIQFMAAVNSSNGVYDFVRIRCLRYGGCFKTRIFGETHVFVSSTESAKQILNDGGVNYTKKYIRSIAELVGHRSLLCASHLDHKFLRSHLINLFSTSFLASFVTQFDQQIVEALRGWESGSTIVLLNQALKITCKAMCKMLMSIQNDDELELLQKEVAHVCEAMLAFPWRFPGTRFHNGLKARRRIIKILEKMIWERQRSEAWHDDFLQRLLSEEGDDGRGALSDVEIGDNILTMLIAGQDTTASAITWMVKFLDENPDVLQNLKDEQFEILMNKHRDRDRENCFLTLEDLGNMCYAPKVVKESLRLASVVPWFPRLVLQDSQIQGYKVNKGWNVNIDVRSLHSHPSIFHHPTIFDPSRFYEEAKPYSFLAFGMGGRQCLGMNLAKAMMLVFLHRLVTSYRWKVIDSDPSIEKWALFSKLKSGCPIIVTRIES
ncbi:abscisic acid 8'-hydroxylase 4 isoform X2 [Cucurbita maxima]|uniref:Abscisic acid 8'-hydroxylase 4 isoform X2 n=1 Tax=Cucurbita maxima TaxID=3661 RepID=A0A6J1KJ46_CUCMA|nr:abscisic acid 8'-hydroxylase 4 isoform X2 [Cucurbita maxima]